MKDPNQQVKNIENQIQMKKLELDSLQVELKKAKLQAQIQQETPSVKTEKKPKAISDGKAA